MLFFFWMQEHLCDPPGIWSIGSGFLGTESPDLAQNTGSPIQRSKPRPSEKPHPHREIPSPTGKFLMPRS